MIDKIGKIALVVGATGAVGKEIVPRLLADSSYEKVKVWTRKELGFAHRKLEVKIVNFNEISIIPNEYVDEIFCALGTTIKHAKSRRNFLKVDVIYVKELAKWGKKSEAKRFLLVSSQGASKSSPIFYSRAKAKAEKYVIDENFDTTQIFALPLIDSKRDEMRFGELFSIYLFKLFPKSWSSLYPVTASDIAKFIVNATNKEIKGVKYHKITAKKVNL